MEELKPCPFCENFKKTSPNAICSFGKEFPDDRPEGAISFWLRHSANGYELHAEAISIDDDGNECCEYDGNAESNFCPICGKPLTEAGKKILANRRAEPENKPLTIRELGEFAEADETVYEANGMQWDLYSGDNNQIRALHTAPGGKCDVIVDEYKIANGFFLYARKPEGSEK